MMVRFSRYSGILALVAIAGGIALFVPEALALRSVALDPWFPTGYLGDVSAWALLGLDTLIVGYIAYGIGFKRYLHAVDAEESA